jgi:hypothetical protein
MLLAHHSRDVVVVNHVTVQKSEKRHTHGHKPLTFIYIFELPYAVVRRPLSFAVVVRLPPCHSIVRRLLASRRRPPPPPRNNIAADIAAASSSWSLPSGPRIHDISNEKGGGGGSGTETKKRRRALYLLPLHPLLTGVQVFIYLKYECFIQYPLEHRRDPGLTQHECPHEKCQKGETTIL